MENLTYLCPNENTKANMKLRLKEAFDRAKGLGLVRRKSELAQEIWKESSPKSAYMNYANLEKGQSKKIDIEVVEFLCDKLQVSAEFLFGLSDNPTPDAYKESVKERAKEIIALAESL